MPGALTTATVMMCPHGGTVQASPASTSVQAESSPMLSASDTFIISGCAFVIGTVPSPCVSVQWVQAAMKSTLSGNPTLNELSVELRLAATQAPQGQVMIVETQPNVTGQ